MTISDETLIAYLDNELAADERARIEAALAQDASLRERLRQQEHVINALRAAFGPVVNEPLSDRLMQTAMTAPVSWRWRLNTFLARAMPEQATPAYTRFLGRAAILLAGLTIGWFAANIPLSTSDNVASFGVVQGPLEQALERQLAADNPQQGPRVGVSFKTKGGHLCRTFDLGAAVDNRAGIACRDTEGWTIQALAAAEPRTTAPYETVASAMPSAVRDVLGELIAGEPLDAEQERQARARGWHATP